MVTPELPRSSSLAGTTWRFVIDYIDSISTGSDVREFSNDGTWGYPNHSTVAVASLKALREHMCDRLDSATPEDRRTVLETLETRVTVGVDGLLEVSIGIPQQVADCVQRTHGQ